MQNDLNTAQIRDWHSIFTLILFVFANIVVLVPFTVPFPFPRFLVDAARSLLVVLRVLPPRDPQSGPVTCGIQQSKQPSKVIREGSATVRRGPGALLLWYRLPVNFITGPLLAVLLLLATKSIGRVEVHDGTIGANNIMPLEVLAFFITLAYIAISVDASGLIRYIAFKVLQKGGGHGRRLFLYLYAFFFALSTCIGNDPIILSGTPFLAYMTRISRNIKDPKAWIYTQFAVSNVGSAILVSSNPTNLVLAAAFEIKFIEYTANVIVPVIASTMVLAPFLLYVLFRDDALVPPSIELHVLPEEARRKIPVNPNIPNARGQADDNEDMAMLEEIMNPYLDKSGAIFGSVIMAATLITILVLNASTPIRHQHPVYWITLPAACIMLCWDLTFGWLHRKQTRDIARAGSKVSAPPGERDTVALREIDTGQRQRQSTIDPQQSFEPRDSDTSDAVDGQPKTSAVSVPQKLLRKRTTDTLGLHCDVPPPPAKPTATASHYTVPTTLVSLVAGAWKWCRETFPTATAVLASLPLPLIPFALCMFILCQSLVTKGWVGVFAYGWDHWVSRTGPVGAVGGMMFVSILLCNFAGTNIGTTILISRVVQAWVEIHANTSGDPISQRTFWATIYSMAIGVNYGAFSTAFSASLAGLLWRSILARKNIHVMGWEFMRVNCPIIAVATIVASAVLVGEVYITRSTAAYAGM
ncbi:hypothetical protein BAUCODRAFT_124558 [Baudoinia panamericana UAMH 10762]|uniref:Citrate transporter-like domain-containing protein n=1 Tax=Baudoinia panamericana (strain UAMH 10762) TaxID=717646 RepID=M2N458_BAUPA|nr:uncharacterized protein BAUCODRAFT_124558 [Baudoinia panamericana UAMH 10762]EMC93804.1 hypothetical protein BAUCODRAFT_124558 [Baudoinia panamericana UAMH 10762]